MNFISNVLGLDVESIQIKKFPFGAATVTSLGMMGVKDCWSPNNRIYSLSLFYKKNYFVIKSDCQREIRCERERSGKKSSCDRWES